MSGGRRVILIAGLYFGVAFLTPVSEMLAACAAAGAWPPAINVVAAVVGGLVAGGLALRAYLDGSHERYKQQLENKP